MGHCLSTIIETPTPWFGWVQANPAGNTSFRDGTNVGVGGDTGQGPLSGTSMEMRFWLSWRFAKQQPSVKTNGRGGHGSGKETAADMEEVR